MGSARGLCWVLGVVACLLVCIGAVEVDTDVWARQEFAYHFNTYWGKESGQGFDPRAAEVFLQYSGPALTHAGAEFNQQWKTYYEQLRSYYKRHAHNLLARSGWTGQSLLLLEAQTDGNNDASESGTGSGNNVNEQVTAPNTGDKQAAMDHIMMQQAHEVSENPNDLCCICPPGFRPPSYADW